MKQRILLCSLALIAAAASAAQDAKADPAKAAARKTHAAAAAKPAAQAAAAPGAAAQSASQPQSQSADYIVAIVNSEPVTNVEVQQQYERLRAQADGSTPDSALHHEALERMIGQKIQLQMAAERGLTVDDLALKQAQENIARQNGLTADELMRRLRSEGIAPEQFRAELRNQLLIQKLRDAEVESRVKVSDLDIDQYLREQKAKAGAAAAVQQLNLGHLLVIVPENASPEQVQQLQAKAQKAADQIRAGESFDAAVREFSDAQPGNGGGVLGLRPADRYPELFLNTVKDVAVGGIAGPVRSPAGFHILKVVERNSSDLPAVVTQTHVQHILLRPGPNLSEEQAAGRLEDYRRRIIAHQDTFADLARRYSEDGSAANGGDLGWANPRQFVPEFEEAMNQLQPGEISPPVASRFGVHLITVVGRREATLNQREQRDLVRGIVREKKRDQAFQTWAQEARARAYVEYREPPQ